jgi:hypothetical protein
MATQPVASRVVLSSLVLLFRLPNGIELQDYMVSQLKDYSLNAIH